MRKDADTEHKLITYNHTRSMSSSETSSCASDDDTDEEINTTLLVYDVYFWYSSFGTTLNTKRAC